ncbi:MAG: hypothetical protein Q4D36_07400 [Bacteroidales bacterium]|nr:hypothetical protein [Bacteroidales bacterium]
MAQIIIALTTLCSSIILYGVGVLGEKHPELIAGFKWSSTPEGIELDKHSDIDYSRFLSLMSFFGNETCLINKNTISLYSRHLT